MWLSDDEQRVWRTYLTMSAELQAEMNRQLQRDCGLSLADYDVLVALDDRGREEQKDQEHACRVNELGDRLGWEQSRLSHQLRRMQSRDLIGKRGAGDDRRGATVELTAAGRAALAAAAPGHVALVRDVVFAGVGPTQRRALERWTTQVLGRLRDVAGDA